MTTFTTSQLVSVLREHNVAPDAEFTASRGKDYGQVNAWSLGDDGRFAIEYGNNGETSCDVADDADDLACWLESPDLDAWETTIQTANVRGESAVYEAADDAEGPFRVLITHYWYGATESSDLSEEFESFESAQEWIDEKELETYFTAHNEIGAPSYKIVTE